MTQTKNKIKSPITNLIENCGLLYELTEENYSRRADYFRSKDCRYLICHVETPIENDDPNIYISDTKMGNRAYDPITPTCDNYIFQGKVNETELKLILKILKIS